MPVPPKNETGRRGGVSTQLRHKFPVKSLTHHVTRNKYLAPPIHPCYYSRNMDEELPSLDPKVVIGRQPPLPDANIRTRDYNHLFTPELGNRILDHYIAGASLLKISQQEGMPSYTTLLRWVHEKKDYATLFESARRLRAIHMEEKALAVADEVLDTEDKDRAAVSRLRLDVYKWAAEVADSQRYGRKTTVEGNPDKPITFTIVTGVPQKQVEEKIIEAEVVSQEEVTSATVS